MHSMHTRDEVKVGLIFGRQENLEGIRFPG